MGEVCKKIFRGEYLKTQLILLVGVILAYCFLERIDILMPELNKDEKKLVRNFSYTDLKHFYDEPEDRNVAWNQEIPLFMNQDMRKARKYMYEIEYNFSGGNRLIFRYYNNEWKVEIRAIEDDDQYVPKEYVNFSLYKDIANNIVVYGYPNYNRHKFVKFVLGNSVYEETVLTYDKNLTFDKEADSMMQAIHVEEMTLLKEGEAFNFYFHGKKIGTQLYLGFNSEIVDSFIISDNNKLYILYYNICDEKPVVKFVNISDNVESIGEKYLETKGIRGSIDLKIPIIIKEGQRYVVIPESWQTYENLKINSVNKKQISFDEANYNVKLEELEKYLIDASFEYSNFGEWEIKERYMLNEKEYCLTESFNGYDSKIILPDEVARRFTKTVSSIEEMWCNIEEIREVYKDYYNHKEE